MRSITGQQKNRSRERGSALVEFGLIMTVLFTMIFGIMDFSRAMFAYHYVSFAAHEATRYASVHGSTYTTQCPTASPWVSTNNCQVSASSTANVTNFVQSFAQGVYPTASLRAPARLPSPPPGREPRAVPRAAPQLRIPTAPVAR